MTRNLPSLFSLELVGSSENMAKSTPGSQVQKAMYLWEIVWKTVKSYVFKMDHTKIG